MATSGQREMTIKGANTSITEPGLFYLPLKKRKTKNAKLKLKIQNVLSFMLQFYVLRFEFCV